MNDINLTKLKLLLFVTATLITCLSLSYIVVGIMCTIGVVILFIFVTNEEFFKSSKKNIINDDLSHISSIDESNKKNGVYDTKLLNFRNSFIWKKYILFGMINTFSEYFVTLQLVLGSLLKELVPYLKLLVVIFIFKFFNTKNVSLALFGTLQAFTAIILSIVIFKIIKFIDLMYALDNILAPIKKIGVNPEKVTLLFLLTFRFFFMLKEVYTEVLYAQKARGVENYKISLIIPFILRALKKSQYVTEALLMR